MSSNITPNLPYELLLIIASEVLANFLHSRIFLPLRRKEWDAVLALSLVSKEFQAIVTSVWIPAVGPLLGDGYSWR